MHGLNPHTVCMLGGSGFVGHHLASHLVSRGRPVRILSRHPERHRELQVLPGAELRRADVHDPQGLREHIAGCAAVINLVGILNEHSKPGTGFHQAHVELATKVVQACRDSGVAHLLHMSALNADAARGASYYLRSKGEAENLIHQAGHHGLHVTSFRPSVIFGPGDGFFNRFARLLRRVPLAFPLACPRARFAPVYVGDIAACFAAALDQRATFGQRYDLCGPRVYTLQEIVEYTAKVLGIRRTIIGLGDGLSRVQARAMEWMPGKPFSYDNYLSLQTDSVCPGPFPAVFGIDPTPLEAVVPGYLAEANQRGGYAALRRRARRD